MAIVLIIDQRNSRHGRLLAEDWAAELNTSASAWLPMPFVATGGDEIQGQIGHAELVADYVLRGLRSKEWWVGVGIGAVRTRGATAAVSDGTAFYNARRAVSQAKRERYGFAVQADDDDLRIQLSAVLNALCYIVSRRSPRREEVCALADVLTSTTEIATRLGITRQGVSDNLKAAGWYEEQALRVLFNQLASELTEFDGG